MNEATRGHSNASAAGFAVRYGTNFTVSQTNTAVKQIKTNVNTVIATPRRVRSHGAQLITSNRADFEMISRYRGLQLEIW